MFRRLLLITCLCCGAAAQAAPLSVVAAESTYGAIATAIGGSAVTVTSIIQNPNVDPHDFDASPQTARTVAGAAVVLCNGIGYDAWIDRLLAANPAPRRDVIRASELAPDLVLPDHNPHLFYDTRIAERVATRLTALLSRDDPHDAALFAHNLRQFRAALARVDAAALRLRAQHPGLSVTATEPVYGYMLRSLGWPSRGSAFQFAVMNDTEPAPAVVAAYEDDLTRHRVALLFVNRQVSDPLTQRMRDLAQASGVPVVGVDEFTPPGQGYVDWLLASLHGIDAALTRKPAGNI